MITYETNKPNGETLEQWKMSHVEMYRENVHGVEMLGSMNHGGWVA